MESQEFAYARPALEGIILRLGRGKRRKSAEEIKQLIVEAVARGTLRAIGNADWAAGKGVSRDLKEDDQ
jgi:hypothetical protein